MPDLIIQLNAALEGRYRVGRELGKGGMAMVYLAHDVRHDRKVALKVLRPELAAVVGADRFLAEIRTTANLHHPHILPLFDSGEADGFLFYVMPSVDGETLREKLNREHQLPVDDSVRIATNVAEALDCAHRHGVIHRDIKPSNILLQDGKAVVSDFGIALSVGDAAEGRLTETGLSLGTPHYMSPEQATGDLHVSAAADVYALGCVLYEMLVGEPPYIGTAGQAILARIIAGELEAPASRRPSVPAHVDAVVRRALERLPADRFATAAEFARALGDPGFRHGETSPSAASAKRRLWNPLSAGLGAVALAFGLAFAWSLGRPVAPAPVFRFDSLFEPGQALASTTPGSFALSPDGSLVVYVGPARDTVGNPLARQLWVRRWDDGQAVPLRETMLATFPSVSPDGQELAFTQSGLIKVMSLDGGPARTVASGALPHWGAGGELYFVDRQGIKRVPANGRQPATVRLLAEPEPGPLLWDVLPGGETALVFFPAETPPRMAAMDLSTGEMTSLGVGMAPRYVATGHLVYVAGDTSLVAARFDPGGLELGPPVPLVADVGFFDVSLTGTLVYTAGSGTNTSLVSVSQDGSRLVLATLEGIGWFPRFSPDGSRVAFGLSAGEILSDDADLWVLDVARGARTRITFGGNNRFYPIWTPDGTRLTHADASSPQNRLIGTMADGSGVSDTLLELGDRRFATSWSPDGRTLSYYVGPAGTPTGSRDLWMLDVDGASPAPRPWVQTPFMERGGVFSPDGRWVAYVSDKSGRNDVYARPYPGPGAEITVSVGGGGEPVWAPSGQELYYRTDSELLVVSVEPESPSLGVGTPRTVFPDSYRRDTAGGLGGVANYDVSPGGDRFVMLENTGGDREPAARLHVVINWFHELVQRVPG